MSLEELNERARLALERAQVASRARSAEAFAARLAERAGGSPDGSTYRRWLRAESVIPAWALIAAAEESGLSPADLLSGDWSRVDEAKMLSLPSRVEAQEAELRTLRQEVAELRQQVDRRTQRREWAQRSSASPPSEPTPASHRSAKPRQP